MNPSTIPDGALVRVHGFVMLQRLEAGQVRLVRRDDKLGLYWFCIPRTGRKVVGHPISRVDHGLGCFDRGDSNCLEVLYPDTTTTAHANTHHS